MSRLDQLYSPRADFFFSIVPVLIFACFMQSLSGVCVYCSHLLGLRQGNHYSLYSIKLYGGLTAFDDGRHAVLNHLMVD